jgi:hypothetical protein
MLLPANAEASAYYSIDDIHYAEFKTRVEAYTGMPVPEGTQMICGYYINPSVLTLDMIKSVPLLVGGTVLAISQTAAPKPVPAPLQMAPLSAIPKPSLNSANQPLALGA